jgi:hypothetical protein
MTEEPKKTRTAKKRLTSAAKPNGISSGREWSEEQRARIAEIAYLRFLSRDGLGGDEVQDWLQAEAEYMASQTAIKKKRKPAGQTVSA